MNANKWAIVNILFKKSQFLKIITVDGQRYWFSLDNQRHCYSMNGQSLFICCDLHLSDISTDTEKGPNLEEIAHFNDNVENSSEVSLPEEYDNDSGTNSDADPHKFYGQFDWCG